jgi:hypothetical protein
MKKQIKPATLFICVVAAWCACNKDDQVSLSQYCDYPTGDVVENQIGRVYRWSDQRAGTNSFYYIGNADPKLKTGGFIPCNSFPDDLKSDGEIGTLVVYSGTVKLARSAEEPLYFGIELTKITKPI